MSLFDQRDLRPMLIGADGDPFDDPRYLFETKWDGERCVAYLDPQTGTELRNKRNVKLLSKVPELSKLHRQVEGRCILDGELMILKDGRPDFFEIQKRSLTSNQFKIQLAAKQLPASFIVFDILFYDGRDLTLLPLSERKHYLNQCVREESDRLAQSRCVEGKGKAFYEIIKSQELEGIVAKKTDSIYIPGKRTKDWIKIKNLKDDDFVVCGYIFKEHHMISVVLGKYRGDRLCYKGHVTLGVGGENFRKIQLTPKMETPPFDAPPGNENAVWLEPRLVCTVKFMEYTAGGGMRQPVFKGLRQDKLPFECAQGL